MLHSIGNTLSLVFKSLMNRRVTAALTVASIAVSAGLLSVVDRVRTDAQTSFANTISGTDLIIGARSGDLNLLLYSVFRIGNPTSNISWNSYEKHRRPAGGGVDHSVFAGRRAPGLSGPRHGPRLFRSLPVCEPAAAGVPEMAVRSPSRPIRLSARRLPISSGYGIGRQIVVSHGLTETSFLTHDEDPFTVSGILARTGTPVDRTVHISLSGMDMIHSNGGGGRVAAPVAGYEPEEITAFLVGLKSKTSIFTLQRYVNELEDEPMTAVIPGVALQQLWGLIRVAEYALFGVSAMVVLASVLGLLATLLVSLNERRREMSVLRSVGARPGHIFALLLSEAAALAFLGALSGLLLIQLGIVALRQYALTEFGIQLSVGLRAFDLYVLSGILGIAVLVSTVPAWRAYRNSLADGLTVRL